MGRLVYELCIRGGVSAWYIYVKVKIEDEDIEKGDGEEKDVFVPSCWEGRKMVLEVIASRFAEYGSMIGWL